MAETIASYIVFVAYAYAVAGAICALVFVWLGVDKLDHQAKGSGWGFRVLIFPGCVFFWPLLLKRWLKGTGEPPDEENPHR